MSKLLGSRTALLSDSEVFKHFAESLSGTDATKIIFLSSELLSGNYKASRGYWGLAHAGIIRGESEHVGLQLLQAERLGQNDLSLLSRVVLAMIRLGKVEEGLQRFAALVERFPIDQSVRANAASVISKINWNLISVVPPWLQQLRVQVGS